MGFFENVPLVPPDPILGLTIAFQNDTRKNKVNLGVGIYNTEELKTPVLQSVKLAEAFLLEREENKKYLPISGDPLYLDRLGGIVFGDDFWTKEKERIASFQTVGGTGALKTGGIFIKEELGSSVWISTPSWPNHRGVFLHCGLKVEAYPYYDKLSRSLDYEKMIFCLEKLSPGSVVVLHAACHNPTGCDLSSLQWNKLLDLFKAKKLIPFFDFAYQGFGSGIQEDARAIRLFSGSGLEMFVAVSNAKNLSLYGERVGALYIVSESAVHVKHISSRVKQMIRTNYSSPPIHGAKVAAHIFSSASQRLLWEGELAEMRERIQRVRLLFAERLAQKIQAVDFNAIEKGNGMFSYIGLEKLQVERLTAEYGIYMPSDGRINVCGLNYSNMDYVVDAIEAVYRK